MNSSNITASVSRAQDATAHRVSASLASSIRRQPFADRHVVDVHELNANRSAVRTVQSISSSRSVRVGASD
jgi:hypothetical protein